jgi:preprotein translocase subunit YajC
MQHPVLAFAPPAQGGQQNPLAMFIPLVLMMVVFWLLILRPQARRQKAHQNMINALAKGDRIVTTGGLFAEVLNVKDDVIVATIADGVKVELAKNAVASLVKPKKN